MLGNVTRSALRTDGGVSVAVAVIALTLFRLLATSHISLVPDEAYYWLWSRVPSAGYYDHPPMIAWWIWLSTAVAGNSVFAIRLLPVLSIAVTSAATYLTARELFDDRHIAARAAMWVNAMFLIGLEHIFATPDAPSTMFWSLATFALAHLRRHRRPSLWLIVGLLAGAGCVSKYTNLFMGLGIVSWLSLDPMARRWRFSPWVLFGGIVAFVTFLPVLVWNQEHHWISFQKQFGRIGATGAGNSHLAEFLAGQFGLINPVVAILAAAAVWTYFRRRHDALKSPLTFLILLNAPLFLYMVVQSSHDRIHQNWTAPVYPALAIFAAVATSSEFGSVHMLHLGRWATPVGIGLSCLVLAIFATPLGRAIPIRSPVDNVLGWRSLYSNLDGIRKRTGAEWIATTDYGLTGELAFQARGDVPVREIVERQRYFFEQSDPALLEKTALLVVSAGEEDRFVTYRKCFRTLSPVETVHREAGGRPIELYFVVAVSHAPADLLSRGCQLSG
jgi:4-amino-4-deoxy-L-arabinose transferase-like glycosyltransferase